MTTFDSCIFNDELDLLEIRLRELKDVVDKFVIVEATTTHAGIPKPLNFLENKERFKAIVPDKIIYVVVDDMPKPEPTRWIPENFQRNAIMRGLVDAQPDDTIIISDVDEIPDSKVPLVYNEPTAFVGIVLWGKLNVPNGDDTPKWNGGVSAKFSVVKSQTPQGIRNSRGGACKKVVSGWHFSYIGPLERIHEKVRNFAHAECDNPQYHEQMDGTWGGLGKDPSRVLPFDKLPKCISEDMDKFKHLLVIPRPIVVSAIFPPFRDIGHSIEGCRRFYEATKDVSVDVECIVIDRHDEGVSGVPTFVKVIQCDKETPVDMINYGYSVSTGDYVTCLLDNISPKKGWFSSVLQNKKGVFVIGQDIVAARKYLDTKNDGFFFYPEYKSLFCNVELADKAKASGDLMELDSSLLTHIQDDNLAAVLRENGKYQAHDATLYGQRKGVGFPAFPKEVKKVDEKPQVSILMVSMFRKAQMIEVMQRFRDSLKSTKYEFIAYVEEDKDSYDTIMNMPDVAVALWGETKTTPVKCMNECLKLSKGNIIVPCSDDTFPENGWYEAVMAAFDKLPNRSGIVGLNDMHRDGDQLAVLLAFSRDYIINEMGGVLIPPCYNAYYGDPEINEVAKAKGKFVWAKDARMEHRHHGHGYPMDDTYRRNMKYASIDSATYFDRKGRGYPIEWKPIITE